ncbi:M48 family metallopeptidase [bacterium]|nr:M48 family metallopeptidase [bacterium]
MNIYLIIILFALIGEYALQGASDYLNLKALGRKPPDEFSGFYDEEKYRRSQEYIVTQTKFNYVSSTFNLILILAFILIGGFEYADRFARRFKFGNVLTGLVFLGVLYLAYDIITIPFSLYSQFVIEERFGFNKMTIKTFVLDKLKTYFLVIILGSVIMGGILFFFERAGAYAWLYAWGLAAFFIVIAQPLYNMLIAPMFNNFTPLEDGKLRDDIERYARKVKFPIKEISVMDGSKRSSHSNAYFSGLFKKRIALFDTLIERHSPGELVAVIAHEVGHYKKRHIIKGMLLSIIHAGIMFYLLSFFINNDGLFRAFRMQQISVYAGLVFFGLLYSPIKFLLSIFTNHLSRKYEFEADRFAAETTRSIKGMVMALKKIYVSNMSNLTPHPLNVFLNYDHPPVLERIKALRLL